MITTIGLIRLLIITTSTIPIVVQCGSLPISSRITAEWLPMALLSLLRSWPNLALLKHSMKRFGFMASSLRQFQLTSFTSLWPATLWVRSITKRTVLANETLPTARSKWSSSSSSPWRPLLTQLYPPTGDPGRKAMSLRRKKKKLQFDY